jgi:hypothetical protein
MTTNNVSLDGTQGAQDTQNPKEREARCALGVNCSAWEWPFFLDLKPDSCIQAFFRKYLLILAECAD